ncbi:unnamed protein product [Effrenium voratum]|uniref:OTU domain-containing protein n=1 Tax=Effrenium voratum TaxID=2562239 RepID=A0AA36II02_9DINO|nr:unnamed protein product [Effrenium voratum]
MNMEEDFRSVELEGAEAQIEITRVGRTRSYAEGKALPLEWRQIFAQPKEKGPKGPKGKGKATPTSATPAHGPDPPADQNIEVDDGNNDERGLDGKTKPKTPEAPSKRCKTTSHGIPLGMELKDNPGAGNCLFAAVADALEAQGRSKRSPAEIRNLAVTHLRTHARSYEGFWKGDAPSAEGADMKVKGFAEYLRLLARDGAWGGSIEVAALAATLAQPIFVFRPEEADGVRVFNPSAKGKPLALWFMNRHYQALIGAVGPADRAKATAAPIGNAADRGGVPAPSTLGGHTSVLGGRTHNGAKLSAIGGCTKSGTERKSRSHWYDPSPAEVRTLSSSSAMRSPALSLPGSVADPDAVEVPSKSKYAFHGTFKYECDLCPFAELYETRGQASRGRLSHMRRAHPEVRKQVARKHQRPPLVLAGSGQLLAWVCPYCKMGWPQDEVADKPSKLLTKWRAEHHAEGHPRVSHGAWQKALRKEGMGPKFRAQRRVFNLNKYMAVPFRMQDMQNAGFQAFTWPRVVVREKTKRAKPEGKGAALQLLRSWVCKTCRAVFRVLREAKLHRCGAHHYGQAAAYKLRLKRLEEARKWAEDHFEAHGVPLETLRSTFSETKVVLLGAPKSSRHD